MEGVLLIVDYIYLHSFQRIADMLDIEIKRWAAGKEGNLRALLSTLQYVRLLFSQFTVLDLCIRTFLFLIILYNSVMPTNV